MLSNLPIRTKIFGLVSIILFLLIFVSSASLYYVSRVKSELDQIAKNLVPITGKLTQIDQHVLEQELALERIFTLLEAEELTQAKLKILLDQFANRGLLVGREINEAKAITKDGLVVGMYDPIGHFV